jgi:16S rRNA (cytosine967-C5)-methyltransferase
MHPKALLDACSELVRLTLKFDNPADATVQRFFRDNKGLGPRERATIAETVFTVLRKKLLFDHFAPSGSGSRERRLAIQGFYGPRDFLVSALSDQEKNWLEQCDKVKVGDLMERHRHNLPDWLVQPLKDQTGDGFWALVDSLNLGAGLDLRVNALTAKRADVQKELARAGIKAVPTSYSPWGLRIAGKPNLSKSEGYLRGDFEVQDEGSQLLALLLDAKRGEMVVDFCAGAGGKTLAIGAGMRSTGRLYAFDTSAHRLDALKPRLKRSGLSNVHPAAIAHERDDRVKRLAGKIDRVLVDAPCSGLGTLRRNPDLKWRQNLPAVEAMAVTQTAILQSAARLLKPGGRLVYATCSFLPQENEAIAQAFSDANSEFTPLEVGQVLSNLKVEGATSLCSGGVEGEGGGQGDGQKYLRLWPHRHGTDGFFAAVWEKQ